ncbi:uncharacterized protein LOC127137311 [Lathyrus oleraceus]|uniref:uncharacterized protein LOC127137311 n=1 Tax=Pisum sativum TaxID=3888 RepID=UPI0021D134DD|nr:uncharacterized protein LOC127137311 [Pisum sativum]
MFMNTLQGPYLDRLIGSNASGFSNLVTAEEQIENGIKIGKIQDAAAATSGAKKPHSGFPKKKEGEANTSMIAKREAEAYQMPYYSVAAVAPNAYQQPTYVIPTGPPARELRPPPTPLPQGYDANVRCEFHSGELGHTIENCRALKHKVQDLIDSKAISFAPAVANIANNPMQANIHLKANYRLLDERIRAIEGFSGYGIDAKDLSLVPNVVLPPKFKASDLPKYKGLSCPRSHIIMYCRKMESYINNDELHIHCFQDSLFGASLDWYMSLERSKIRSWKDLSKAFLRQYKYNMDMARTRLQRRNQACKSSKTFKEYAERWREMASRVRPALTDVELVDIFMSTFQGLYYEKIVGSSSSNFSDIVTIGKCIENGLKTGKIAIVDSQTMAKKSQGLLRRRRPMQVL